MREPPHASKRRYFGHIRKTGVKLGRNSLLRWVHITRSTSMIWLKKEHSSPRLRASGVVNDRWQQQEQLPKSRRLYHINNLFHFRSCAIRPRHGRGRERRDRGVQLSVRHHRLLKNRGNFLCAEIYRLVPSFPFGPSRLDRRRSRTVETFRELARKNAVRRVAVSTVGFGASAPKSASCRAQRVVGLPVMFPRGV